MKKTFKSLSVMLITILCLTALVSCFSPKQAEDIVFANEGESSDLICVSGEPEEIAREAALSFKDRLIGANYKCSPSVISVSSSNFSKEIIFGESDREISISAKAFLEEKSAGTPDDLHWVFVFSEGKLAIVANSPEAYQYAEDDFFKNYVGNGSITLKSNLKHHGKLSRSIYNEKIEQAEKAEAERLEAERNILLEKYKPLYESQRDEIAESALLGTATANIGTPSWGAAPTTPIDEHPRVLITSDDIPLIKERLKESTATNKRFLKLLDSEHSNDGRLGEVKKDFDGRNGLHNYDKSLLELIQVKALGYLAYGHELFGYQAIYYMKNFLLTLDIQYISSDQCREYGNVMFTAALVYDWCYDLLTEEDKAQLIAGVETRAASGNCGDPSYTTNSSYKKKMEVGFPPSGQGALAGHGAEGQVLRNYLAAAIAFYGDNNSWWNYVASRVYGQFVPVRNYYYQSGIAPQGTGLYVSARHTADLFSAWLLESATGSHPYVGLDETIRNFLGFECAQDKLFSDGDGTYETTAYSRFRHLSYISAYLFDDAAMTAWAEDILGTSSFTSDTSYLTSALYVALRGTSDVERGENRYEGMELIQYNGHPLGQYIIREAWNSNDSAAVYMKIKELNTGNHEHCDAGTFEIYYKGMLSSDGGCYNTYGKPQTAYFHKSTISHNGLIVFNPSKWDYSSNDASKKWYSGGQISPGSPSNLNSWLASEENKTGTVTGRQHGYIDGDMSKPLYAYIAGDITKAYPSDTASYVGRSMLTVYTGNEDRPMVFFVYDDITSVAKNYEKRFLLQISSKEQPIVDESKKTVITENGDGRLVLTCLSDDVAFRLAGGRSTGSSGGYSAEKSMNYCINGYQCLPESKTADDGHWGRVEIYSTKSSSAASFLNVIFVTDKGNEKMPIIRSTTLNKGVKGAIYDRSIVALFATDRNRASEEISCKVSGLGEMSYYVSGVAAGTWTVTVDNKVIGSFEATEDGGMLTFTAPAGEVVITPAN